MAKPRVFVSSTYYDLKHIRASLETFIQSLGYESILFESGDIPFHHVQPLDISCYDAVENAHIFVLIIGGRYGSSASNRKILPASAIPPVEEELEKMYKFYNSITVEEYKRARQQDLPIYIFIEKGVAAEYQTYKENKHLNNVKYAHVDNVSIFKLIDEIFAESRNNLVREFERFEHISSWLKDQWAGLFADHLSKRKSDSVLTDLTMQVATLNQVADALRTYSEAIVRKVEPDTAKSDSIIEAVENKLIQDSVSNTPFIKHLNSRCVVNGLPPLDLAELIKIIARSQDLDDFLASLQLNSKVLEWVDLVRAPATRDYRNLRKKLSELSPLAPLFSNTPKILEVDPNFLSEEHQLNRRLNVLRRARAQTLTSATTPTNMESENSSPATSVTKKVVRKRADPNKT